MAPLHGRRKARRDGMLIFSAVLDDDASTTKRKEPGRVKKRFGKVESEREVEGQRGEGAKGE